MKSELLDEKFVKDRIVQLRRKKGISERRMSLDLGHSPSYMNGICSGSKMPSMTEFLYICYYFDITPAQFFNIDKEVTQLQQRAIDEICSLSNGDIVLLLNLIERLKN